MAAAPEQLTYNTLTPEQVVASQAQVSFPLSLNYGDFWLLHDPETSSATRLWWLPSPHTSPESSDSENLDSESAQPQPVLPENHSLRSRVHEYGGMPYTLGRCSGLLPEKPEQTAATKLLVWVEEADQQLYYLPFDPANSVPVDASRLNGLSDWTKELSDQSRSFRYGEPVLHPSQPWVIAIEEEHAPDSVINRLVAFHLLSHKRKVLAEDADFYTSATLSPDGEQLVWVQWHHPHQPWSASQLATLSDSFGESIETDELPEHIILLNGEKASSHCSLQQPRFCPNGQLYFMSDQQGFWGLYRFKEYRVKEYRLKESGLSSDAPDINANTNTGSYIDISIEAVYTPQADCASAPWQFGNRHFQFYQTDNQLKLILTQCTLGLWQLIEVALPSESHRDSPNAKPLLALPDTEADKHSFFSYLSIASETQDHLICLTAGSNRTLHLARFDLKMQKTEVVELSPITDFAELANSPQPERLSLKLPEHPVYGIFHPSQKLHSESDANSGSENEQSPLLIITHGGPTSCAFPGLQLIVQFWCQQGFNVLELDHRGSTGYGRAYRDLLKGEWGEADLEDARLFSHYLQQKRGISANKVAIRGHSAGGYTCMRAAALGYFDAVASLYGISDLERLAASTHKFESHYPDWLIADADSHQMLYQLRSPRFNLCQQNQHPALLMFQGGQDKIVPPDQSLKFKSDYQNVGGYCELVLYPEEGHGFRQYENRLDQLNKELAFYRQQRILVLDASPDQKQASEVTSDLSSQYSHAHL